MDVFPTTLPDLKIIQLDVYGDSRGFFVERYHAEKFKEIGLNVSFRQDNHSRSAPGVLRGLHFQPEPPQGKLVGCISGSIWDVAVDIRKDSPTLGKHFGLELNDIDGKLLWIPPGFAHGFCVLGDKPADVLYKLTEVYNPKGETGIKWDDENLKVSWPLSKMKPDNNSPIISERDKSANSFNEYLL